MIKPINFSLSLNYGQNGVMIIWVPLKLLVIDKIAGHLLFHFQATKVVYQLWKAI